MNRTIKIAAALFGAGVIALSGYLYFRQWSGNFGVVVADEVYRSNQPTAERLDAYVAAHHIRSVLNLRGALPGAAWYDQERQAARQLGLTMTDFPMSASAELRPEQFAQLVVLLRDMPKPLLIHCRSGADRTGLASVIYLALIAGVDEETAERQLSIRYGHFAVPFLSDAWPMDVTWEMIEDWAGIAGS
jgi:protein tyrosine/serine phosphatase